MVEDVTLQSRKTTGGVEYHQGKRYRLHTWVGYVRLGTGAGPRKQVIVGITDYEYFCRPAAQKKASCRRRGHIH